MKYMNPKTATENFFASWTTGFVFVVAIVLVAAAPALAQGQKQDKTGIPEIIDINTQATCPSIKGLPKDLKDVKGFKHALHAERYLKGNSGFSGYNSYTDDFTCAACHGGAQKQEDISREKACGMIEHELSSGNKPLRPKDLYHKMCLKCHKNMKKAHKVTGPVRCKGCHTKKNR